MFNLPPSTLINKPLFKKAVFEKFNLKAPERERFDADISRMVLLAHVSPSTISALKGGESKTVTITLRRADLCHWDEASQGWMLEPGDIIVHVGGSLGELPLRRHAAIR